MCYSFLDMSKICIGDLQNIMKILIPEIFLGIPLLDLFSKQYFIPLFPATSTCSIQNNYTP